MRNGQREAVGASILLRGPALLALSNVAYVQNHIHNFLRNTRGGTPSSQWNCVPQSGQRLLSRMCRIDRVPSVCSFVVHRCWTSRQQAAGNHNNYTNNLVQMQLKTTDTTTGFSDKDIKTMTKLSFTAPRDFHELARLVENMAGITEILFGARSPLADMLYEWGHFLTRAVGLT
jgi:hypothetical protein